MNELTRWGVIGAVALLLGMGGVMVLTDDELDHAYFCTSNSKVGIFESLSKTNVTGYWKIDGTTKQSTCTKGRWIPLKDYCKENNITNCARITPTASEDKYTGKYWCTDKCDPITE